MKKFRYKYPAWMKIILILATFLALFSLGVNVFRIIKANGSAVYDYLSTSIAILISIVGLVLFAAMLISSGYKVTDDELILYWGLLKNKFPIKAIKRIVLNQTTEKLILYYNEDNYFVLNAKTVDCPDLADELRKRNDRIIFELTSSTPPEQKNK